MQLPARSFRLLLLRSLLRGGLVLMLIGVTVGARQSSLAAAPSGAAQSITQDELRTALPAEADLPGFQQTLDTTTTFSAMTPSGSVPAVVRDFVSPSSEVLSFELMALPDDLDTGQFAPSAIGEDVLRDAAGNLGRQAPEDFSIAGSLGIGEDDQSATWEAYSATQGGWNQVYADLFIHGHVLGLVLYAAPRDTADPGAIIGYAARQDTNVAAASLP